MHTILVIDDNPDIRENTAEILQLAGYRTLTAENGREGVELAFRERPDVIICDIMMPVLDGYGVLHLLNKNDDVRNTPFIFLSARTERSDQRKGMEMGADDYITKPFEEIELLNAIEIRLRKKQLLGEKFTSGPGGVNEFVRSLRDAGIAGQLRERYDVVPYQKKQTLYQQHKRPRYLFLIVSGKVKCVKMHEDGKEYITELFHDGDFVGHAALIEDKNYDDSCVVLEDAEVLQIPKDDFLQLLFSDAAIMATFIRLITRNVRDKEERLLNLAYSSLRKRVAKALTDISEKFAHKPGDPIAISRDDIAHYVGTATESLIRTLSDFKSEKLIAINEGKIVITEPEKLKKLLY